MAQDFGKGKNYQGTFAGGQGPVAGQHLVSESEEKSVYGGEGKHIHTVNEGGTDHKPTGGSSNFDLHSKSYAGPQNLAFAPTNKGVVNPSEVQKG